MNAEKIGDFLARLGEGLTAIALGDVALWLLISAIIVLLARIVRRWVDRAVKEVNRRHQFRKMVGYTAFFVILALAIAMFVGRFGHLATVLGLVGAGLAIALQDLGKSAAGWVYLTSRSGFGPGSRVEVEGVMGEVIDIGVLKTTVLEVGNIVFGRQSSGRLVTIPNSKFLNANVFLSPSYSPYAWQELQFLFTYESDWKRAVELLEELAAGEYEGVETATQRAFRQLEKRYAFKWGARTPIVYVKAEDSGIQLTVRYLTHIRERRGSADRVTRGVLEAAAREPGLQIAYPTMRIYRRGEGESEDEASGGSNEPREGRTPVQPDPGG